VTVLLVFPLSINFGLFVSAWFFIKSDNIVSILWADSNVFLQYPFCLFFLKIILDLAQAFFIYCRTCFKYFVCKQSILDILIKKIGPLIFIGVEDISKPCRFFIIIKCVQVIIHATKLLYSIILRSPFNELSFVFSRSEI
jgi:hypothetical protein